MIREDVMGFKHIEVTKENSVLEICLNRPPVNVLNIEMMREMTEALLDVEKDKELKLLVVCAKGKAFCAGADVGEHHPDKVEEMMEKLEKKPRGRARLPRMRGPG